MTDNLDKFFERAEKWGQGQAYKEEEAPAVLNNWHKVIAALKEAKEQFQYIQEQANNGSDYMDSASADVWLEKWNKEFGE